MLQRNREFGLAVSRLTGELGQAMVHVRSGRYW
jgi:hypothetical protein